MILRFDVPGEKSNDIYLVEATSAGVHVKKWSTIRPAIGQFYKKIVARHLNFERTEAQLTKLEQFLKEVNGHKYSIGVGQVFARNRAETIMKQAGGDKMVDDDRTFFCSELVAKAFKVCGVLQETKEASSNFFPVDFSTQSKKLKLQPGIIISGELHIQIDEAKRLATPKVLGGAPKQIVF